jgi:hypothetical protein
MAFENYIPVSCNHLAIRKKESMKLNIILNFIFKFNLPFSYEFVYT